MAESSSERSHLAKRLVAMKDGVARSVSDDFFRRHPDWVERFGDRGRQFCTADACFHIDFLAGAIEAGSPDAFAHYSRWTTRMLAARGIAGHTLEENLAQLEEHLAPLLLPAEREMVAAFLANGKSACAQAEDPETAPPATDRLRLAREVFLTAILGGQRQAALNIVNEALRAGHTFIEIFTDLFTESLHRVGELWELNRISVAQEHIATAITQYAIASIYPQLERAVVERGSMVVTGVSGELHQIGANLVADAMEASGWNVRFLGTNLPHSSILATLRDISADVLCISTTLVANLPSVAELLTLVRTNLGMQAPKIVLGGAAYHPAPEFVREFNAVGPLSDLRSGLAALCS